jgi:hypothetical protein
MPSSAEEAPDNATQPLGPSGQTANAKSISEAIEKTEAAFQQLMVALNAEAHAHSVVGGDVFYKGIYDKSLPVFEVAAGIGRLRDHIEYLHSKWKRCDLVELNRLRVQDPEPRSASASDQPVRFNKIKGMTASAAAKKLGVKPAKVLPWLESGMLKGYRKLGGGWKIPQIELVAFSKKFPDLVGRP